MSHIQYGLWVTNSTNNKPVVMNDEINKNMIHSERKHNRPGYRLRVKLNEITTLQINNE